MKFATRNWIQMQFDNFASRISAVFAKKEDVNKLKAEVDDMKSKPARLILRMDLDTGNLLYKFESKSE